MDYSNKTPGQLADIILQLSAEYENLSDELGVIFKVKDVNWTMFRDTVTSDKQADRLWSKTTAGAREQQILLQLRKIKQTISSIKTYLRVKSDEAHHNY